MPSLANQVVIVTGASAGIGEATARRLVRGGAKVVLTARRQDRLNALAHALDPTGANVLAVAGDVTSDADRRKWVEATLAKFGRIDGLVNNAGYGTRGPVEIVPVDLIRKNYETNIFSLIALTQLVIPTMRAQGGGCIVNIGSVAGRIARPLSSIYDSTKHALEAITDGLRGELKPFGIRVALVRPGFITTEFIDAANAVSADVLANAGPYAPYYKGYHEGTTKLRTFAGQPDDIARLVEKALASDDPAPRYNGPFHAKIFLFLRWLLPRRVMGWMVRLKG
ncbi:SDR family NAD(P)-dependent oxidoreductase [Oleiharenicola lentus]|uniref:SDR family NAD(P)-dependent oxidoreductase n=1 Tax=Oleiharenicola lentus TaxID=2508720 RepID=A0A4Q1C6I6_9BACT|nr:SDR family NAD(P)-dependent oxidoreductase [Oleiharenicola lentus]RXK54497.1 SDR family NAD(P)-dependent oxidoreductase [Oleiharenicola lentus]